MKIVFDNNSNNPLPIKHVDGDINFNPKAKLVLDIDEGATIVITRKDDEADITLSIEGVKRPSIDNKS